MRKRKHDGQLQKVHLHQFLRETFWATGQLQPLPSGTATIAAPTAVGMDSDEHDSGAVSADKASEEVAVSSALSKGVGRYGCSHYRRRCLLVAPCCDEAFWCRHCHNAAKCDNEQDPAKRHTLDRKAVKEVVCALCSMRQPTSESCMNCGSAFGAYTCLKCNFFDDDLTKQQFHCDECSICRVGGRERYFHCKTCNCCYAVQLRGSHICIENSMHHNCPVCFEYLFESIKPIHVMPCGHTLHEACLQQLIDHRTYICPVCSKTFMNVDRLWSHLDAVVAQTPMPDEYREMRVRALCNDCNTRFETNFHVVGHKCTSCGGYNTRRV